MLNINDYIDKILCADCLDILKQLPDKCVDLVLTDPPYFGIVKNDWDNQWKDIFEFQKWVSELGKEFNRVLKDNGSFYWFGDDKTIAYCQVELDKYFRLLNNIVWRKPALQTMKGAETVFRSYAPITERCLFYDKGEDKTGLESINDNLCLYKSIRDYFETERQKTNLSYKEINEKCFNTASNGGGMASNILTSYKNGWTFPTREKYEALQKIGICKKPYEELRREYEELRREYEELRRVWNNDIKALDVLDYQICNDKDRFHPTQKPINLISYLIERSSKENDLILDCFSGSGTTAVACHNLKRRFICIEKDEDYYKASVERLLNAQAQQKLF